MPTGKYGGTDVPFPVRGAPGGWRHPWDEPSDDRELRQRSERIERWYATEARCLGRHWQREIRSEQRQAERERKRRGGLR